MYWKENEHWKLSSGHAIKQQVAENKKCCPCKVNSVQMKLMFPLEFKTLKGVKVSLQVWNLVLSITDIHSIVLKLWGFSPDGWLAFYLKVEYIYILLNYNPEELMLQKRDLLQLEQEILLYYLQSPADFWNTRNLTPTWNRPS